MKSRTGKLKIAVVVEGLLRVCTGGPTSRCQTGTCWRMSSSSMANSSRQGSLRESQWSIATTDLTVASNNSFTYRVICDGSGPHVTLLLFSQRTKNNPNHHAVGGRE